MDSDFIADLRRARLLGLAWFDSSHVILGESARPLSLASSHALNVMGNRWLDTRESLTLDEEAREIAVYAWLHTAPLADVCAGLWMGAWATLRDQAPPVPDVVLAHLRMNRDSLMATLDAAAVIERPKPAKGKSDTPRDVIPPSLLTYRAMTVARATSMPMTAVLWELPLVQAMQVYHAARWEASVWTVRPGECVPEADLGDLTPDWMGGENTSTHPQS